MNFDIADLDTGEVGSEADGGMGDTDETRTAGEKSSFSGKGWRGSVMNLPVNFQSEDVVVDAAGESSTSEEAAPGGSEKMYWRGSLVDLPVSFDLPADDGAGEASS